MGVVRLFLLCLATFHCTVSADLLSEYAHHAILAEKMKLFWTVDWDAETVSFAVEAETTGWVGFGLSTSGHMIGSDVVIGWVKDNKGYLTDRFAEARAVPPIDDQQDYVLTDSKESDGKTLLKFTRKFDTCDPRDRKLEVGPTTVVFAYHSEDPVSPTELKYHEFRGVKSILLLSSVDTRNIDETGWRKLHMTTRNITIPGNKSTTYWCTLLKAPELKSRHHVTQIVPHIQEGNEELVHHLLLYECYGNFTEEQLDEGVDCNNGANLPFVQCRSIYSPVGGWALGQQGLYYPPHVGYPIGESDSPKYFVLETHYDNQRRVEGRRDSSGLTLYYTDKLRKYDAGIVNVGIQVTPWHIIPPKQKNWISVGYCMHQCTESLFKNSVLPEGGINIFAAAPHTHMAGRATWTKHVRNGKELPEITRDDHFDFTFSYTQVLKKEINIQPGDDIIHYCQYDTMNKDQPTPGGPSTYEEMCLNFIFYYPRIKDFPFCDNTFYKPTWKLIDKLFPKVKKPPRRRYWTPLPNWPVNWTNEVANDLKKYQNELDSLIPGCWFKRLNTPADARGPLPDRRVAIPRITEPLPPKKACPVQAVSGADMTASCAFFVGVLFVVIPPLI